MSQDRSHSTFAQAVLSPLGRQLARLLDRRQPSETAVLLVTAVVVGVTTGLGAVLFVKLIAVATAFFFGPVKNTLGFLVPWSSSRFRRWVDCWPGRSSPGSLPKPRDMACRKS